MDFLYIEPHLVLMYFTFILRHKLDFTSVALPWVGLLVLLSALWWWWGGRGCKNTTTLFLRSRKRQQKGMEGGVWEAPPLYSLL